MYSGRRRTIVAPGPSPQPRLTEVHLWSRGFAYSPSRYGAPCLAKSAAPDVAPSFYPARGGVWRSIMPCWAAVAAVRGAEPSVDWATGDGMTCQPLRRCAITLGVLANFSAKHLASSRVRFALAGCGARGFFGASSAPHSTGSSSTRKALRPFMAICEERGPSSSRRRANYLRNAGCASS
jgi:hypothetical protein